MSSNLQADVLILAAGFGKRLRPLTDSTPKPLIDVAGRPLIEWNLDHLKRAGLKNVFINSHHLKEKISSYFAARPQDELSIELVEESPQILETGGAIKNIKDKLQCNYLLTINGDAMFDESLDLRALLEAHSCNPNNPIATMLLRDSEDKKKYGLIGVSKEKQVVSFLGKKYFPGEVALEYMYTGVQVLSSEVFDFMSDDDGAVFSITKVTYPKVLSAGMYVGSEVYTGYFNDVGTEERLLETREFKQK